MQYEELFWDTINEGIRILVEKIRGSGKRYAALFGLPRGGLIPGVMLSHRLEIPLVLSTEEVKLYAHQGMNALIVDDISDSGKTLKPYKEEGYDIATLYTREHTTITPPTYTSFLINHDRWLVFPWEIKEEARNK